MIKIKIANLEIEFEKYEEFEKFVENFNFIKDFGEFLKMQEEAPYISYVPPLTCETSDSWSAWRDGVKVASTDKDGIMRDSDGHVFEWCLASENNCVLGIVGSA